jgi:hypothetical protein
MCNFLEDFRKLVYKIKSPCGSFYHSVIENTKETFLPISKNSIYILHITKSFFV